jgi:N-acetylmuramoyl-L-alanine amidase
MPEIKYIVIHCTATRSTVTIESIRKRFDWDEPEYHYIIDNTGTISPMFINERMGDGPDAYSNASIHVAYIGGVDAKNNPKDTRTLKQKNAMKLWIRHLKHKYPDAIIQGHSDFPNVQRNCPAFDVQAWLKEIEDIQTDEW